MSTIFDTASGNIAQAGDTTAAIAQGGLPAQSMNSYINPHRSMVLDDTVNRLQDQFQMRLGQIGDQAVAGGAFGGSRHGVVEGMAFDDYMRNVGEVSNQINQQGYDSALNAGFRDVDQRMNAAGQLHGMGMNEYNLGRTIMQDQAGFGQQQQNLNQAILDIANGMFGQYTSSPSNAQSWLSGILQGSPLQGNVTQSTKPGLFDYLGLGLQTGFGGASGGK